MKRLLLVDFQPRWYPISISYVASTLENCGVEYDFINPRLQGGNISNLLYSGRYWGVASGGLLGCYNWVERLFKLAKQIDPTLITILGGRIALNVRAELLLEKSPVDYIIRGDAENTLPIFLPNLLKGRDFSKTPGLVWRLNGVLHQNPVVPLGDLREIYPSFTFTDWRTLRDNPQSRIPISTGRGCNGKCSFCAPYPSRFLERPIEKILQEVEFLARGGQKTAHFSSTVLFDSSETIVKFAKAYKQDFGFPFDCNLRVDHGPEILSCLHDSGLQGVCIGVESFDQGTLDRMGKGVRIEMIEAMIRRGRELKIPYIEAGLIFGSENTDEEEIELTLAGAHRARVQSRFYIFIPRHGSQCFDRGILSGRVKDEYDSLRAIERLEKEHDFLFGAIFLRTSKGDHCLSNTTTISEPNYYRLLHKTFVRFLKDNTFQDVSLEKQGANTVLIGNCIHCGARNSFLLKEGMLGRYSVPRENSAFCVNHRTSRCYGEVSYSNISIFQVPYLMEFERTLRKSLSHGVVLVGPKMNLKFLLEFSLFVDDPGSVLGVISDDLEEDFLVQDDVGNRIPELKKISWKEGNPKVRKFLLAFASQEDHLYRNFLLSIGVSSENILRVVPWEDRNFDARG